jgi:hypothetical protein
MESNNAATAKKTSPTYWRVSSSTRANVELAFKAKQWGMRRAIGVRALRPGDRIVFYVSQGAHSGYLGMARVTSDLFTSRAPIWPDETYPVRFSITPDQPLRSKPITREAVMASLGRERLKYLRQAGVIRLAPDEYQLIVRLLRVREGAADPAPQTSP